MKNDSNKPDQIVTTDSSELSIDSDIKMPDLSLFDDMPDFKPRLERLFRELESNSDFRKAAIRHAQRGLHMDRDIEVAGPIFNSQDEFVGFSMTMDEFRTRMLFKQTGGNLLNMIELLENHIHDIVSIFDGTNVSGKNPSLEDILSSHDYDSDRMMQIIRYLRILPIYKQMLNILTEIKDQRSRTYLAINGLLDEQWEENQSNTLSDEREAKNKRLQASIKTNVIDELTERMSGIGYNIGSSDDANPKRLES